MLNFKVENSIDLDLGKNVSLKMNYGVPIANMIAHLHSSDGCKSYLAEISEVMRDSYRFKINTHGFNGFSNSDFKNAETHDERWYLWYLSAKIEIFYPYPSKSTIDDYMRILEKEFMVVLDPKYTNPYMYFDYYYDSERGILEIGRTSITDYSPESFYEILHAIKTTKHCLEIAAMLKGFNQCNFDVDFELEEIG